MTRHGILKGTFETALDIAGVVPTELVHALVPKGGAIDEVLTDNKRNIRRVVGAGVITGGIAYAM
jgi:hypothetical protein